MKTEVIPALKGRRILIAITGSIAAVKTPILVSGLVQAGAEVRCLVSPSASRLVSPLSLSCLSRNSCYQDEDQWEMKTTKPLHIELAEWAEIVVVAPLSASSLSRWAQGLADGIIASVLLASEKPVIAAAAMNTAMWRHSAVQKNWHCIQKDPRVLPLTPSPGLLACDRIGEGRMVEPELIHLAIESALTNKNKENHLPKDWEGMKLLVTSGPTIEDIDPARQISNRSSGRMGVLIAQAAKFRGAEVDLIHGPMQIPSALLDGLQTHSVRNADQMQKRIAGLQASANAIVMAAAVADIRKRGVKSLKKMNKESLIQSFSNEFELVPDLLAEIISNRSEHQVVLGFAALTGDDSEIRQLGEAKRAKKGCDLMMANPIDRPGQGFEENLNGGFLLGPEGMNRHIAVTSKLALANELLDAIRELQTNFSYNN